jgi:hypothetical protein
MPIPAAPNPQCHPIVSPNVPMINGEASAPALSAIRYTPKARVRRSSSGA